MLEEAINTPIKTMDIVSELTAKVYNMFKSLLD